MSHSERSPQLGPVTVETGLLSGVAGNDPAISVFKGVPFAAPPVGELRWQAPQPPLAWEGERKADSFGPICPQYIPNLGTFYGDEFYLVKEEQSEDCLYLNIWTGAKSNEERRPVMVWFHGGGFVEGSGSLGSFHGEMLAQKGVVLVTVNYRLGAFGFFAHPALAAASESKTTGNYGLLDQIASLRWVRDNIAAFGGDADNVTIFGQSAGAMSVYLLQISPLAKGLFKRVIAQSGSAFSFGRMIGTSSAEAYQRCEELAKSWGASSAEELRALPTETLLCENINQYRAGRFGPIGESWFANPEIAQPIINGEVNSHSLMVGATADEWTPMTAGGAAPREQFEERIRAQYGELAERYLELYPFEGEEHEHHTQIAGGNDLMFAGMRYWADLHSSYAPGQAYLYYFERRLPGRNSEHYGAFHSGDLYYVFGTLHSTDRPWAEADHALADAMTSYWSNFAATGNPNGAGVPEWPAYASEGDQTIYLGETVHAGPSPRPEQMAFHTELIRKGTS
jgi:para-nitrobenzyl esterase